MNGKQLKSNMEHEFQFEMNNGSLHQTLWKFIQMNNDRMKKSTPQFNLIMK